MKEQSPRISLKHKWKWKVKLLSHVRLFATPWTVAYQAPQSMEFSRQEYWSGLPFPSPGDLPSPGIEPRSPALQADALPSEPPGKCTYIFSNWQQDRVSQQNCVMTFLLFIPPVGNGKSAPLFPGGSVKNPPAMPETWVQSLGWEDLPEKGMATHSSILAWRIPMDRGVWWATVHGVANGHNSATKHSTYSTCLLLQPN